MPASFAELELPLYWITERERVRQRKEAGAPLPWSDDPIFQRASFCNVERERDRVTVWIREHWREPHRDDPDVWFLMVVARLINAPEVLGAITLPLPWDRDRFVAEMAARRAQQLPLERAAYTINAPADGRPKYLYLADDIFSPLWAAREAVRPKPGDTCQLFFDRLTAFSGIGSFYAGQFVADTKFVPPLSDAADCWDFVAAGPGSGRWLNVMLGRAPNPPLEGREFYETFAQFRALITPKLDELGLRLSAQDLQNCCCEAFKLWRAPDAPGKCRGGTIIRRARSAQIEESQTETSRGAPIDVDRVVNAAGGATCTSRARRSARPDCAPRPASRPRNSVACRPESRRRVEICG